MSEAKILSFGNPREIFRAETVQETLKKTGRGYVFESVNPDFIQLHQFVTGLLQDEDVCLALFHENYQEAIFEGYQYRILELAHVGVADSMIKTPAEGTIRWWPRNFLATAFRQMLAKKSTNLDLSGAALVIGANPLARVAVHAVSAMGIRKFIVSDPNGEQAQSFVDKVNKLNFGIQARTVKDTEITQLPSVCAVAVNTLNTLGSGLAQEISYFNFLRPFGTWIDFGLHSYRKDFQDEVISTKAKPESPAFIWALADQLLFQAAFELSVELDPLIKKYQEEIDKFGLSNS